MFLLLPVVLTAAPFERDFPNANVFVRPGESTISTVIGLEVPFTELTSEAARAFLFRYGGAYGLREEDELVLRSRRGEALVTALRFERRKGGVPVYGAELILTAQATSTTGGPLCGKLCQFDADRGFRKRMGTFAPRERSISEHSQRAEPRVGTRPQGVTYLTEVSA